jgi:2-polyprenyl-6-hydroxyphenyl methylase/3-demethylubiquinone-9 3-methyltransferase
LFRLVRQPIYVAFALTLWTVPTWTPDQLVVAVVLTAYCVLGPLLKEARFRQRFGNAFVAYSRRVPYWVAGLAAGARNDLSIYGASANWWGDDARWLRALRNMVPARLAFFDPLVGDWTGKRVLDLGCGGGFMAEPLAARGARVTGIDPSAAAIAAARLHAAATGLDIDYLVGSGEALPFDAGTFDVVVCVDVLEHIAGWEAVISEIGRVLRPEGLFLFDTINRNPLAAFVMVTIGERGLRLLPRGTHDPALFLRPGELGQALRRNGFVIGRFAGLGPRGLTRRLELTFGRLPTTAVQYLGSARLAPHDGVASLANEGSPIGDRAIPPQAAVGREDAREMLSRTTRLFPPCQSAPSSKGTVTARASAYEPVHARPAGSSRDRCWRWPSRCPCPSSA